MKRFEDTAAGKAAFWIVIALAVAFLGWQVYAITHGQVVR